MRHLPRVVWGRSPLRRGACLWTHSHNTANDRSKQACSPLEHIIRSLLTSENCYISPVVSLACLVLVAVHHHTSIQTEHSRRWKWQSLSITHSHGILLLWEYPSDFAHIWNAVSRWMHLSKGLRGSIRSEEDAMLVALPWKMGLWFGTKLLPRTFSM